VPSDLELWRAIWLLLAVSFLTIFPVIANNLFIVWIAETADSTVALLGGLRSLGGLTALATGVLAAPIIDRTPRAWAVASGLVVLAISTLLASLAQVWALAAFYLLAGVASSVLLPAAQAAGVDSRPGPVGTRAATVISSITSLGAVAAAPLLAWPAGWWGWRGDFVAIALLALLLALAALRSLSHSPPRDVARPGYRESFRLVAAAPGAGLLLLGATFRSTLFLGHLTYNGAFYIETFGVSTALLGLIYSLSGASFFLANQVGARYAARAQPGGRNPITAESLLLGGLALAGLTGPAMLLATDLLLAVLLLSLFTAGSGLFQAGVIGLLVGRYPALRGALLGLNVATVNLGIFAGAALGAGALALGGYDGLALTLLLVSAAGLVCIALAVRQSSRAVTS
jgi:predicted MFS family arabinose efflux permease